MALKKDEIRDMRKNDECVNNTLKDLARICKKAYRNGTGIKKDNEYLRKEMFYGYIPVTDKKTEPKHEGCDMDSVNDPNPEQENEKRICRCMRYYDEKSVKCKSCILKRKWKRSNECELEVIEYEWPMKIVTPGVGGIDLLLKDKRKKYAVETKRPEGNTDTISLMIAEIMTYTYKTYYHPAIAIFENGFHHRKIKKLIKEKNKDFFTIAEYIKVFLIKYEENNGIVTYKIVPLEINGN